MRGQIKNVIKDKRCGFIKVKDNERKKDCFFDESSLKKDIKLEDIKKGMEVEFEIQKQSNGKKDKAINCDILEAQIIVYFKTKALQINTPEEYDEFCENAKKYAEILKGSRVTTSTIRKVYTKVLYAKNVVEIKKLRPQLAYTAGRNEDKPAVKNFMDLLDYLIKNMSVNASDKEQEKELEGLKEFMEAIVAYRKYVGNDS